MTPELVKRELLPAFVALLGDTEADVRTAMAAKLLKFCTVLPEDVRLDAIMQSVLPQMQARAVHSFFSFLWGLGLGLGFPRVAAEREGLDVGVF